MKIRIAHSPDSDDYFLFWALRERRLPWGEFEFEFETHDTAKLNILARDGVPDVVAISAAAFPDASPHYLILSSGASVGRGFGPKLVTTTTRQLSELRTGRIGIPGKTTTAGLVTRHLLPEATLIEIPISPFELVFNALSRAEIHAAVLIHEGQMNVEAQGFHSVTDLGMFWEEKTALPLPLGINCVKRSLGLPTVRALDALTQASVVYARENLSDAIPYLCKINQLRRANVVTEVGVTEYLNRYANHDSERLGADVIEGLRYLLAERDFKLLDEHFTES